ncbi:MAG: M3 family oligoendopeptidase [Defluviicoccus sp.]|nr:M3 family oligoendopeptidase [Defluviicoccus sp.]
MTDQPIPGGPGALPEWNLAELYPAPDSPALAADLDRAERDATVLRERWKGRLAAAGGAAFGRALASFEAVSETVARAESFAQLLHAADLGDPDTARFYQSIRERATAITGEVLFFSLEIARMEDDELEAKLADPGAARYRPWLRDIRLTRPYRLAEEAERLFHVKRLTGRAAWTRLFDETMAALRFPVEGRELTAQEAFHLLSDPDGARRREAAESVGRVLAENVRLFALIANTLAKDKEIEDGWRGYETPQAARHLANRVETGVVDALTEAVTDACPRLSHRYYALKARWLGVDALEYWDRNAPLPGADDSVIRWDEARDIVLDAYGAFSPAMRGIAARFFDDRRIDAALRPGKSPGAFSHSTVPSAHPYILLNYQGRPRDVMTLAHELGHGVHQVLAGRQGHLMAETPLTLAETASVFGEMLTFRALLDRARPEQRPLLLAAKVEDMLNTVIRQIAFYRFESRVHEERRREELTADRLCEIWLDVQRESLGPAIRLGGDYRYYWSYIPHFVHSPFYVYAYAFGDCLVNALYAVFEGGAPGFAENYLRMLEAGGTLRHRELLAPFGLDAGEPSFWARGLAVIEGMIDELEDAA